MNVVIKDQIEPQSLNDYIKESIKPNLEEQTMNQLYSHEQEVATRDIQIKEYLSQIKNMNIDKQNLLEENNG